MVYEAHLLEQKKDVANNKKLYKGLKLASGAGLLSSFSFVRMKDYQSIIGYKTRFFIDDNKVDYSDSYLPMDGKNNQKFNPFYLFQIKTNYVLAFWLHNT